MLVGYEPNSKAWRVLADNGKVIISRDVICDEQQRPAAAATSGDGEPVGARVEPKRPQSFGGYAVPTLYVNMC